MRRVILSTALVLFLAAPVYAQEQRSADDIVQKMTTELNLTPEQASAIKPIIEDNMAKRQALMNSSTDKSAIKDQMTQLKQDENQKLSQVLSADQMATLNSLKEQNRGQHHGKRHQNSGSGE